MALALPRLYRRAARGLLCRNPSAFPAEASRLYLPPPSGTGGGRAPPATRPWTSSPRCVSEARAPAFLLLLSRARGRAAAGSPVRGFAPSPGPGVCGGVLSLARRRWELLWLQRGVSLPGSGPGIKGTRCFVRLTSQLQNSVCCVCDVLLLYLNSAVWNPEC